MSQKFKVIHPVIVVNKNAKKPCYSIEYYDLNDNQWHIGYSSFDLQTVINWFDSEFDIVSEDSYRIEVIPI